MSTQEKPPREWWVTLYFIENGQKQALHAFGSRDAALRLGHTAEVVHVIEYSAYESLRQQNAYLQQDYAEARDNQNIVQARLDEMRREAGNLETNLKAARESLHAKADEIVVARENARGAR